MPCRSKQHSAADRAAGRQRIANSQNGVAGIVISASLPGKLLCTAESQPAGQSAATDSLSVAIAAKADATNISTNATAANATASNAMVAALRWFTAERGISAEAVAALHISHSQEFMPQTGRKESCVCFNYFERGELVNTKFRDGRKNFKMTTGAELIPYNIDSIEDTPQCIITEGEVDALSFVTVGRTDVVSVPSGANKNLTWLDRFVESHFENKDVIYLAVDNDRKGLELQQELLRRLGRERCRILTYGEGCKDANEHLLKYGANSLLKTIEEAPEQPLEGVYTADDVADDLRTLFENGFSSGAPTGLETLDRNLTFELGRLCVVTGVPGSGKSEFIDELVLRLCLRHGWKPAFFSPENLPLVYHLRKLAEKLTGRLFVPFSTSESLYRRLVNYLTDNVCHILPKDDFTAETILEKARELVRRRGIRTFVFDPFNRLEHLIPDGMSETQYISAFLDKLTNFAVRNNCLVILVAHPRKMNRDAQTGRTPVPTLYDINGSAAFFNKCDFGLTVERDTDVVRIHVQKVKFRHLGQPGIVPFVFNTVNGRYTPCDEDPTASTPAQRITNVNFDCESWLPEMTDDLFS
ncbi:AAA family ATPase [uncultured Bacteroides sp.]|uniref:AAA family ATPase n=1 Tax=uncultured Bacteroides sp. TaxID=162156 RepID=UPI00374969A1